MIYSKKVLDDGQDLQKLTQISKKKSWEIKKKYFL